MATITIIKETANTSPRIVFAQVQHGDLFKVSTESRVVWYYKVPFCFLHDGGNNAVNVHDGYPCSIPPHQVVDAIAGVVTINIESHPC